MKLLQYLFFTNCKKKGGVTTIGHLIKYETSVHIQNSTEMNKTAVRNCWIQLWAVFFSFLLEMTSSLELASRNTAEPRVQWLQTVWHSCDALRFQSSPQSFSALQFVIYCDRCGLSRQERNSAPLKTRNDRKMQTPKYWYWFGSNVIPHQHLLNRTMKNTFNTCE